jgi:hypothetical protein
MSPPYTVELTGLAEEDFAALDHSLRILALKQLRKLEGFPSSGESLGNKFGFDLSGHRSLYFAGSDRGGYRQKGPIRSLSPRRRAKRLALVVYSYRMQPREL